MNWNPIYTKSIFALVCLAPIFWVAFNQPCDDQCAEWDYVESLLLVGSDDGRVARWPHDPIVATNSTKPRNLQIVTGAIVEINKMLEGSGMQMKFELEPTQEVDIAVIFLDRQAYRNVTEELGAAERTLGFAQTETDKAGNIVSAQVVVSDFLTDGETWGVVLHELGHSLGISGHTDRFRSSLFFEEFGYGALSDGYSERDRNLLKFLYSDLQPGSREEKVRSVFNVNWSP